MFAQHSIAVRPDELPDVSEAETAGDLQEDTRNDVVAWVRLQRERSEELVRNKKID